MLTFEAPVYDIGGIVVFRDHAVPDDFYYLAGPPHITRTNGEPVFTMLEYRKAVSGVSVAPVTRDQLGGAFLMMEVDCSLSPAQLSTINGALSALLPPGSSGQINLTPVLYTRGTVNIIALDYQQTQAPPPGTAPAPTAPALVPPGSVPQTPGGATSAAAVAAQAAQANQWVRGVVGTSTPSLMQDLQASFSLSLTPDAAVLLDNAYQDDLSPIGVMYELQFTGLRPALSVKAHGDKQKIYEHLKMAFHAGYTSGSSAASAPPNQQQRPPTQNAQPVPPPGQRQQPNPAAATPPPAAPAAGQSGAAPAAAVAGGSPTATAAVPPASQPATTPATPPATPPAAPAGGQPTPQPAQPSAQPTPQPAPQPGPPQPGAPQPGAQQPGAQQPGAQNQSGGTSVALAVDIGYEVEKMVQDSTITVEIIRQRDDQSMDALQTQALDLIKQMITEEFFKPQMTTVAAAAGAAASQFTSYTAPSGGMSQGQAGKGGQVQVGFQLQYKKQEELDTFDIDFTVAAPETRTHAPNGFFSALLSDVDKATHIREINLDDPFFRQIDVAVSTTGEFARYDIQSVDVELQHGGTVDAPLVHDAIQFTPTGQTGGHFTAFPDGGDYTVRHRTSYAFGDSPDIAAQPQTATRTTDWISSPDRDLLVHPPDDVAIRSVFVEPGVIDWDVVQEVETTLTYNDPANSFTTARTYLIAAGTARAEWRVRLTDPMLTNYTLQHRWHLKEAGKIIDGPVTPSDLDHLYVPDPFADRLEIVVNALVDKTSVARVDVEIDYQDPNSDFSVQKIVQIPGPDFAPVAVQIPLMSPDSRDYSYRATLIKLSGDPELQPAVTGSASAVYITAGGHYVDVNVILLESLASAGLDGLQVDLRTAPLDGAQQQTQTVVFAPTDLPRQTVRLLMRADQANQYEYQTTAFLPHANPVVRVWAPSTTSSLVLQPAQLTTTA